MITEKVPIRVVSVANLREHWAVKAKRAAHHRSMARLVMGQHLRPTLPVVVTFTRVAPRQLDDDNLRSGFKAIRDGVADWLGVDDRHPGVEWRYEQAREGAGEYAVRIRVEVKDG